MTTLWNSFNYILIIDYLTTSFFSQDFYITTIYLLHNKVLDKSHHM